MSYRLKCFGGPMLYGAQGALSGARPGKALALLVFCIVEARPVTRDEAATLLWPHNPDGRAKARMSVRGALVTIREWLGKNALNNRSELIELTAPIACDVHEAQAAMRAGRHEDAAHLMRGGLLEGMRIDSNAWELWVEGVRGRFRDSDAADLVEEVAARQQQAVAAAATARATLARRIPARPIALVLGVVALLAAIELGARRDARGPVGVGPTNDAGFGRSADYVVGVDPRPGQHTLMGKGEQGKFCGPMVSTKQTSVEVDVRQRWTSMGFTVNAGCDEIEIAAAGMVKFDTDDGVTSPDGRPDYGQFPNAPAPWATAMALICRIGSSPPFLVGRHAVVAVSFAGPLECGMNEGNSINDVYRDNSGSWRVRATVRYNGLVGRFRRDARVTSQ